MTTDDIRRMERTLEELDIDIDTRIIWVADAIKEMEDEQALERSNNQTPGDT